MKSAQTCLLLEGQCFCAKDWRVVNNLIEEIAHGCSAAIVRLAVRYHCQAIVFEHLGKLRIPKGFYGAKWLQEGSLLATGQDPEGYEVQGSRKQYPFQQGTGPRDFFPVCL